MPNNAKYRLKPKKLYCYIDETGQDTGGDLFIVSVVVTESDRDKIISQLEKIEKSTGKGRRKWSQTRNRQKHEYIGNILSLTILKGKLNYAVYRQTTDYLARTILTVARAITAYSIPEYKAVILMDGLPKSQIKWFGSELRHLKIKTEKVRGIRKEENDCLMRLADAVCGFVREATKNPRHGLRRLGGTTYSRFSETPTNTWQYSVAFETKYTTSAGNVNRRLQIPLRESILNFRHHLIHRHSAPEFK